jgi:DNA/RNA-binding domain of Phe-tRNA-synthetase-like protein
VSSQDRAEEFRNDAALQRYRDVFETFGCEVTGG